MTWYDAGTELLSALIPVISPVLAGFLVTLFSYGISYLRAQTSKIKNEMARRSLEAALVEAEIVATDAVKSTNQKFVDAIKNASADGRLTQDEIRQAMQMSRDYFTEQISKGSLAILKAAKGPIDTWLNDFLEAKLYDVKTLKGTVRTLSNPSLSGSAN